MQLYLQFGLILEICAILTNAYFAQDEYFLRQLMLGDGSNYSNVARPTRQVDVQLRLNVHSINEINTKAQSITTSGWLTVKWTDPRLRWIPSLHGGIEYLFETQKVLWRPELLLNNAIYFSVNSLVVIGNDDLLIRVAHTGEVLWEPPELFTTSCEIDVTHYPFDRQRCTLEITSWAYTITEVNLTHLASHVFLGDFHRNGEWTLEGTSVSRRMLVETEGSYSQLDFTLILKRRAYFYVVNIILPTTMLSFLVVVTFILPFECGEKASYALTVLLAYSVFMLMVSDNIPTTSLHISVLGIYLVVTLFIGSFSTIMTVFNMFLFHHLNAPILGKKRAFINNVLVPLTGWEKPDSMSRLNYSEPKVMRDGETSMSRNQNKKDKPDPDRRNNDDFYSWQDVALMADTACFRIFGTFVCLLNIVFMIALPLV